MKKLDHPNVLGLIGVTVEAGNPPYIVMPYMANGSLLSFLRRERENLTSAIDVSLHEIVCYVHVEILEMEHTHSMIVQKYNTKIQFESLHHLHHCMHMQLKKVSVWKPTVVLLYNRPATFICFMNVHFLCDTVRSLTILYSFVIRHFYSG